MVNLHLPRSTKFDMEISKDKIFMNAITQPSLQKIYNEQVESIIWSNKISSDTYKVKSAKSLPELEIFNITLKKKILDKRILRQLDKSIPYYIFHIMQFDDQYQAVIANKSYCNGKIVIENYAKSPWLEEKDIDFSFPKLSIDKIQESLFSQINKKYDLMYEFSQNNNIEEYNKFVNYCKTLNMTRSYKPLVIIATISYGGIITIKQLANFFVNFYKKRRKAGLKPETGSCIFADEPDNFPKQKYRLLLNPAKILCDSGFFEYDKNKEILYLSAEVLNNLSNEKAKNIINICNQHLDTYFSKL